MLSIEATKSSPEIRYDDEHKVLSITGESYPENSFEFFAPVFLWLKNELPKLDELSFRVHIRYMNSSSTKCMLDILDMLEDRADSGARIQVRWYYDAGNERALDLAEEFKEDLELPFDIRPLEPGASFT